ncbi:MAG: ABC transporter substrate-binding protein [Sulfolobales archaeon]|nr:ABC transporter substrate-binding protein [Sulfolobales archaeon]
MPKLSKLYFIALAVVILIAVGVIYIFLRPAAPIEVVPEIEVLRISQKADLSVIDVQVATDAPTLTVFGHVYETLFRLRFTEENKPVFEPYLVESYEYVDNITIKFKLREGVLFHDGKSLTSHDVKASFERGPRVGGLPRILLGPIAGVEVIDNLTFVIKLKYPFAPIIAHLAHPSTAIIPAWIAEVFPDKPINSTEYIIGTGPYKFIEFRKLEKTILGVFDKYWGEKPTVKRIEWIPVEEDDTRIAKLEAGDIDIATHVPPHLAGLLKGKGFNIVQIPSTRIIYIGINNERIPDPRVRQALNYAIDKNAIVSEVLEGAGRVADAPIPSVVFGYTKLTPYEYDPVKARKMLEEAGWIGREVLLIAPAGRYLKDREIAEAVQMYLQAAGLKVRIEIMEWAAYIARVTREKDFDLYLLGWSTVTLDADYGLFSLFRSGAPFNRMFYVNTEVDRLLDSARSEVDRDKRLSLYKQAQELVWSDAPWIFLHIEDIIIAMRPDLENVEIQPIERWILTYVSKRE